jgi:hypothetical protein
LQQQQQHQQLQQQALPLAGAALQPAADEVQCISEQMEDALLSSSLSYGAASPSAGSQQLLQPSLQQARSSQLLTQSQLRSSSSGPGQKSDSGQRKGASSKPGGKRVAAHAKLQLLYNAKLAEYDQLKVRGPGNKQTIPPTRMRGFVVLATPRVILCQLGSGLSPPYQCPTLPTAHSAHAYKW